MNSDVLKYVTNIYALIGLFILAMAYIIPYIVSKRQRKREHNDLVNRLDRYNETLLKRIEELKESKNVLDLQSSMDIIDITLKKSMLTIMVQIRNIIHENDTLDEARRPVIYFKIKNTINTQYDEDILILSRIYYGNEKLSKYIINFDKNQLITEIHKKVELLHDDDWVTTVKDIMEYIENRYSRLISTAKLDMN